MIKRISLVLGMLIGLAVPFAPVVANDLYNTPLSELTEFEDLDAAELETLLSDSFAEDELAAAMKEYAPEAYSEMINAMLEGVDADQTIIEMSAEMMPYMEAMLVEYLPYGDDKSLLLFSQAMQPLMLVVEDYPGGCQALIMGDHHVMAEVALSADAALEDEMKNMYIRVLKTYDKNRQMPTEDSVMPALMKTMMPVIEAYGADFLIALENPGQVDNATPCLAMSDLYANISRLPEHEAAELLRFMVSMAE